MIDYEYYYEQYRRAPKNSINPNRELADYHSIISTTNFNLWSGSIKRPMTTSHIDGNSLLGLNERPCSMNGSFPKGKGRRKPLISAEKKINTGDVYISLVPVEKSTSSDALTNRSEKTRSPLSMATGTHYSTLPDVQRRSADIRNRRIFSATVFDDNDDSRTQISSKHSATTHANGAWIRRFKSMNTSQLITDLLRDQKSHEKVFLQKRLYSQLVLLSSPSKASFTSSSIKTRFAKH